jgi:hypothetical protein
LCAVRDSPPLPASRSLASRPQVCLWRRRSHQTGSTERAAPSMTASSSTTPAVTLPIYASTIELPLYLNPSYLGSPLEGVREQLNRSVLRCARVQARRAPGRG